MLTSLSWLSAIAKIRQEGLCGFLAGVNKASKILYVNCLLNVGAKAGLSKGP